MNWEDRIVADVAVLTGKPVVRGTRLAVVFIIDLLAQGWSEADILANYPRLSTDDIKACLQYAGDVLHGTRGGVGCCRHGERTTRQTRLLEVRR